MRWSWIKQVTFRQTTAPFCLSAFHSCTSILTKMLVQLKYPHTLTGVAPMVILICPSVPDESPRGKTLEKNYGVKPNKPVWRDEVKAERDR